MAVPGHHSHGSCSRTVRDLETSCFTGFRFRGFSTDDSSLFDFEVAECVEGEHDMRLNFLLADFTDNFVAWFVH